MLIGKLVTRELVMHALQPRRRAPDDAAGGQVRADRRPGGLGRAHVLGAALRLRAAHPAVRRGVEDAAARGAAAHGSGRPGLGSRPARAAAAASRGPLDVAGARAGTRSRSSRLAERRRSRRTGRRSSARRRRARAARARRRSAGGRRWPVGRYVRSFIATSPSTIWQWYRSICTFRLRRADLGDDGVRLVLAVEEVARDVARVDRLDQHVDAGARRPAPPPRRGCST